MEYQKSKSASKIVMTRSGNLQQKILDTLGLISEIVGGTLGPGGQPVLIERQESGLPASITKDGVTVFRALGLEDPVAHCIMETARDVATRTASEAGDGTTTATILGEALVRNIVAYCKKNPTISPQYVMRELERIFRENIAPAFDAEKIKPELDDDQGQKLLWSVANVSANSDTALADAVMRCFDFCGDEGNVTITEKTGESAYETEQIEGYPILGSGYEESCGRVHPKFINDTATQRVVIERPLFILYHGRITSWSTVVGLVDGIGTSLSVSELNTPNVVLVSTGFSEDVLYRLAMNYVSEGTLKIYPMLVPNTSPQVNAQLHFLHDLAAIVGATVIDPLNNPMPGGNIGLRRKDPGTECIGNLVYSEVPDMHGNMQTKWVSGGVTMFEATRFRSTVIGVCNEDLVLLRIEELKAQAQRPESQLDKILLQERIARLSGGIARLNVVGSSSAETKEKRDRAEDAVCAVRGALKHGCVPGAGWMLLRLCEKHLPDCDLVREIVIPSFRTPVIRLLQNSGIVDPKEIDKIITKISKQANKDVPMVYDCLRHDFVNPMATGLLDSVPAVLEAIRNAMSLASTMGTTGGVVVFRRDATVDREDARASAEFDRAANWNPADERA